MSTRFIPAISRTWLAEELYGFRAAPSISACRVPYLYAKAILFGSAAGPARAAQREHVSGLLSAHFAGGTDSDLLQFVNNYDRACDEALSVAFDADAASRTRRLAPMNARVVVYDAMAAASADGDAAAASADVSAVAKELGVTAASLRRMADLCRREASLEDRRRALLMGDASSVIA